ncbi:helix-turn-helix domain-containing protein [Nitrospira sp. KM1]|uniref:helix-turn-helix domain-containing protein n=1 Tax=Nitrospira sp. KM1 TaxID=1936990 RepID=UPI0018D6DC44
MLLDRKGKVRQHIHTAYRQYGYRLAEIADYLGVHAATVSRRLKDAEQANV